MQWGQCNWSREALLAAFGREPENPVLQHPLSLQSAYNTVIGHEAPFTTCHSQGTKTVDFVMYTADVFSGGAADCTGMQPKHNVFVLLVGSADMCLPYLLSWV